MTSKSDKQQPLGDAGESSRPDDQQQQNAAADAVDSALADIDTSQADSPEQQLRDAEQRVLRAQAELENFRKRSRRELQESLRYASLPLMRDLLGVIDNLQRAIEAAEQSGGGEGLLEGVKMVEQQLQGVLSQWNCTPIDAKGQTFDPNKHEAIAQEASSEHPAGVITRVTQAGYQLHDRVVRPSQVLVSSGPPPETNDSDAPQ